MSINIFEHLTNIVTPAVLGDKIGDENRVNLLQKAYAIFVSRFMDKDVVTDLATVTPSNNFFERLLPNAEHRDELVAKLSDEFNVPKEETLSLVTTSAPVAFSEVQNLAGSTSMVDFLKDNVGSLASFIPTWAYALIPAGVLGFLNLDVGKAASNLASSVTSAVGNVANDATKLASDVADDASKIASNVAKDAGKLADNVTAAGSNAIHAVEEKTGGLGKVLLPLIALLILGGLAAMLMKSCGKNDSQPAPSVAPVASVATDATASATTSLLAPTLAFATGADGALTLGGLGNVGNDDLKGKITDAFINVFGTDADKAVNINVDPSYDVNFPAIDKLTDVLNLVKGVPSASVKFDGNHVMVSSPDAAATTKLIDGIKALLPSYDVMSDTAMTDTASVASATESTTTISATEPTVIFEDGRLKFYFATGKFDIAPNALEQAQAILESAKQGKKLGISGYTDSTGNAAANEKLSKNRAKAVQKFLMDSGVPETQLELRKPEDTVGATGKDQEGRRVEVYVLEENAAASTAN